MKNVIIFGSAEWDFLYQRPRAIAEELSEKGHNVYFFEPLRPIAKDLIAFFSLKNNKNNLNIKRSTVAGKHLKIVKWYCPTAFRGTISPLVDKLLFSTRFNWFLRKNNIQQATIIIAMPFWYNGLLSSKYSNHPNFKLIYDCIDEVSVFARNKKILSRLITREKKLIKDCKQIVCTAQALIDYVKVLNPNADIKHIPNGVGLNHFLTENKKAINLTNIPKPIVGFVGGIYSWVDIDLMWYISEKLPNISFVFVGPSKDVDLSMIKKQKNVYFLGPVEYSQVPAYVNAFDVCIIPFKLNDIIQSTDPIKIYEYFSLMKPIVVTDFPEARKYNNILYIGKNKEDFVNKIKDALDEIKSVEIKNSRYEVAYNASWKKRAELIQEIL